MPLVLVFSWPLLPLLRGSGGASAFSLEEPVIVGYARRVKERYGFEIAPLEDFEQALLRVAHGPESLLPDCAVPLGSDPFSFLLQRDRTYTLLTALLVFLLGRQVAPVALLPGALRPGPTPAA